MQTGSEKQETAVDCTQSAQREASDEIVRCAYAWYESSDKEQQAHDLAMAVLRHKTALSDAIAAAKERAAEYADWFLTNVPKERC